jgi:hypothetical protein
MHAAGVVDEQGAAPAHVGIEYSLIGHLGLSWMFPGAVCMWFSTGPCWPFVCDFLSGQCRVAVPRFVL